MVSCIVFSSSLHQLQSGLGLQSASKSTLSQVTNKLLVVKSSWHFRGSPVPLDTVDVLSFPGSCYLSALSFQPPYTLILHVPGSWCPSCPLRCDIAHDSVLVLLFSSVIPCMTSTIFYTIVNAKFTCSTQTFPLTYLQTHQWPASQTSSFTWVAGTSALHADPLLKAGLLICLLPHCLECQLQNGMVKAESLTGNCSPLCLSLCPLPAESPPKWPVNGLIKGLASLFSSQQATRGSE